MAVIQGRTRKQLRQSVGFNLGAIRTGTAYDAGSTTTLISLRLVGGDDNYNGKWIVVADVSNSNNTETRIISDYTASAFRLTLQQALSFATAAGDTFEIWEPAYDPDTINEFINQAIIDATGHAYDRIENLSLHTDGHNLRFDIPSNISMIKDIYYRNAVEFTQLQSGNTVWDSNLTGTIVASVDTQDKKQGTGSLKLVTTSADGGDIAGETFASKDISKYDYLECWIKSTVATSDGNLKIHLHSAAITEGIANSGSLEALSIPALTANTWTYVRIALANPETDTAIIAIALEHDANLADCQIRLDDISVVRNDTSDWVKVPRHLWRIDKESSDIVFDNYIDGLVSYSLLKIEGGDKPALLSGETDTTEIDDSYVIARATALAYSAASGGPNVDPDAKRQQAAFWFGMSQQSKQNFPILTNVRTVT